MLYASPFRNTIARSGLGLDDDEYDVFHLIKDSMVEGFLFRAQLNDGKGY